MGSKVGSVASAPTTSVGSRGEPDSGATAVLPKVVASSLCSWTRGSRRAWRRSSNAAQEPSCIPGYMSLDQLYLRMFIAARRYLDGERTHLFW
jgi:hypothetical protein